MRENWQILQSGAGRPSLNMALDEALLESSRERGQPLLRFYGWTEPAGTFGYAQRYAEVAAVTALRPLIRRPTGGGLVPHDRDWTYSLVFPPGHWWFELPALESYRRVHEWLRLSFLEIGVESEVAPEARREIAGQCFAGWERFDLLWSGRKIAGAAQRRNRHGLLVQGSVQPPPLGLAKADWQKALCDTAHRGWGVDWIEAEISTAVWDRADALERGKYGEASHNCKR